MAAALKAEKLILMTDVPGVMRDKDDVSTKFAELDIKDTRQLVAEGVIAGGMIPKVRQDCYRLVVIAKRPRRWTEGQAYANPLNCGCPAADLITGKCPCAITNTGFEVMRSSSTEHASPLVCRSTGLCAFAQTPEVD